MKRRFRFPILSAWDVSVFFLIAGMAAGTIIMFVCRNELNGEGAGWRKMQTLIQGIQRLQEGEIKRRSRGALFFRVWFQRMEMALILWFAGMTPVALPAVWGACLLLGIEMALLLAGFTVCSGIWGLPVFLATLFPQGIFYGLVGGMLFFWAFSGDKRPRLSGFLILLSVLGLGAALEVWAGPFFISLVTAHLSF